MALATAANGNMRTTDSCIRCGEVAVKQQQASQPLDLVAFLPTGDYEGNTRRNMLAAVAHELDRRGRGEKMLCVERPVCPLSTPLKHPRKFGQWLAGLRRLRQVGPNVWAWTPTVFVHDLVALRRPRLRQANKKLLHKGLARALSALEVPSPGSRLVSWVFHPFQVDCLTLAQDALKVYECHDEYAEFAGMEAGPARQKWFLSMEAALARSAGLVLTTSQQLAERMSAHNRRVALVPNGVEFERFHGARGAARPAELEGVPRPIVGFVGKLNEILDFVLLGAVASRRLEWSFVFVAPFDGRPQLLAAPQFRSFASLPNVHLLGWQPYARVPAFINAFDVCTIPFVVNDLTNGIYPLKLHEYFALGKPVVATPIRELEAFADVAYLAGGPQAFVEAIGRALAEGSAELQQKRIALAQANSWQVRAQAILRLMAEAAQALSPAGASA